MTIDNEFYDGIVGKPDIDELLKHYGVMGMKWGVRKQPETKGGIKKRKKLTNKQKKILKRAAIGTGIVAGTLLAAYGGYKLNKFATLGLKKAADKEVINQLISKSKSLYSKSLDLGLEARKNKHNTDRFIENVRSSLDADVKSRKMREEARSIIELGFNSKNYLNNKNKLQYINSYVKNRGKNPAGNFAIDYVRKKYKI